MPLWELHKPHRPYIKIMPHNPQPHTWRTVQKDALWRLYTNSLEQLGVAQRQLHQLTNLGKLLAHATHIIIANL